MLNDPECAMTWVSLRNGIRVRLARYQTGWGCEEWEVGEGHDESLREPSHREKRHRFATQDHAIRFFSIFFDALSPLR